jgi:hypothetical protein
LTPEISDPLIDPFYHHGDDLVYDSNDFQTARLNEEHEPHDKQFVNIQNFEKNQNASDQNESSSFEFDEECSFDNSDQMKLFLKSLKNKKDCHNTMRNEGKEETKEISDISGEPPQKIEFDNIGDNENISLEMIQEETEQDTTKRKESALHTPDRPRAYSHLVFNKNQELPGKDETERKHKKDESEVKAKLIQKALTSVYTSKTSHNENISLTQGIGAI